MSSDREFLTIADLVAMPHLGLRLVAGSGGAENPVLWTHTSELADPGPWLEGGELLIVNGIGIPRKAAGQVEYIARLARHRLAGIAVSVRAPELTAEMLAEADRLAFPVLGIPREIPFIELSYLVANASDRSARGRLSRHLQIFETLRLRNSPEGDVATIYAQLERVSGYRLALLSPAGRPLLPAWPWVPDGIDLEAEPSRIAKLKVIGGGFMIPLLVGDRVTAYLVGLEHPEAKPGGLAALQHVSTLAALDAIDDQRRREMLHRESGGLLAALLDSRGDLDDLGLRLARFGLAAERGLRLVAVGESGQQVPTEIEVRDWLADRELPHLLLRRDALIALVDCDERELRTMAVGLGLHLGVSARTAELGELPRLRRQALWSLNLATESAEPTAVLAEQQLSLAQWLNPDLETRRQLASSLLRPLIDYDAEGGAELLNTLSVYFHAQGRLRPAAAQLFVHEHTLSYRIKRIEQLTGRDLRNYRDAFELWLAIEALPLIEDA